MPAIWSKGAAADKVRDGIEFYARETLIKLSLSTANHR